MKRFRMLLSLLVMVSLSLIMVGDVWSQASGIVSAQPGRSLMLIAIPPFIPTNGVVPEGDLSRIILNDLKLSGFFNIDFAPQESVYAIHSRDLAAKQINYAEWTQLGANYLVKGEYSLEGDELVVTIRVYDPASGSFVYGRKYTEYKRSESRLLAHHISNYLIERLISDRGVADTKILFVRSNDRYGKSKQICVMDADGANVRTLTQPGELTATPAWGLNGAEIYYTTYVGFNPDLAGQILRTGARWWVSRRAGFNLSPAWCPKRQQIALTLSKDGNSELYTLTRDNKDLRRLTTNSAIDSSPAWSPDGNYIAFTSDRTGSPQIYIIDVNSLGSPRRLTMQGNYCDAASWGVSEDGEEKIAFASRLGGVFQICTINPDGSDYRQITSGSNNEDPSWAPNGRTLCFTSDRSGGRQIYSMYMDGSALYPLTSGQSVQSSAWSPFFDNGEHGVDQ